MQELFTIGGQLLLYSPPASSLTVEPMRAEEEVTLLSGQIRLYFGPISHVIVTLAPPENYAIPLSLASTLKTARANFGTVTLEENSSTPGTLKSWTGQIMKESDFSEIRGSRQWFTYRLVLRCPVL